MKTVGRPEPYQNDAAYLTDEVAFVSARCTRIGFEREIGSKLVGRFGPSDAAEIGMTSEQKRELAVLQGAEDALRARIDDRMAANKKRGPSLGIAKLVATHDLTVEEAVILLVCALPCISVAAAEPLASCGGFSFAVSAPTVETIAEYLGLDMAGRIRLRWVLGHDGRLVRSGLIVVEMGASELPHQFPSAGVALTAKAFGVIAGVTDPEPDEVCPTCGQRMASW